MRILGEVISGAMVGVEWLSDDKVLVVDLVIFRLYFVLDWLAPKDK